MFKNIFVLFILFQLSFTLKSKLTDRKDVFTDWRIANTKTTVKGNGAFAENIKCDKNGEDEQFSAMVTLPTGFGTVPVFNEASNVNPSVSEDCVIKQMVVGSNKFSVRISDFDACGVQTQKASDGALWMSVSLRFPMIGSLRTADDEVITLMCRPQDRIIVRNHVLDLKSQLVNPSRTVFSSSPLDFDCNLDVLVKSDDDNSFTRMAPNDDVVEVGQDIQLKATVRPGDGWKYVMLKDVTVHKVTPLSTNKNFQSFSAISSSQPLNTLTTERDQQSSGTTFFTNAISIRKPSNQRFGKNSLDRQKRQIPDAAFLVLSDGCRNPTFRAIAADHPIQDSDNSLSVRFNFKAFMFQDMDESGSIRITAKVISCVEEEDCRPIRCIDDDEVGYGRRRRRSVANKTSNETQTENYTKELSLKVVMPRFRSAFVNSEGNSVTSEWFTHFDDSECRYAIYLIGTVTLTFCLTITLSLSIILIKFKTNKH